MPSHWYTSLKTFIHIFVSVHSLDEVPDSKTRLISLRKSVCLSAYLSRLTLPRGASIFKERAVRQGMLGSMSCLLFEAGGVGVVLATIENTFREGNLMSILTPFGRHCHWESSLNFCFQFLLIQFYQSTVSQRHITLNRYSRGLGLIQNRRCAQKIHPYGKVTTRLDSSFLFQNVMSSGVAYHF